MDEALRDAVYYQILERVYVLKAAPVWDELPQAEKDAFDARMTERPLVWSEVTPADKQLIRDGELQVSSGQGRLVSAEERGDWEAIDAAIDADDEAALDAALFTVGHGFPKFPWLGGVSTVEEARALGGPVENPNVSDDPGDLIDVDDLPDDDSEWVGV